MLHHQPQQSSKNLCAIVGLWPTTYLPLHTGVHHEPGRQGQAVSGERTATWHASVEKVAQQIDNLIILLELDKAPIDMAVWFPIGRRGRPQQARRHDCWQGTQQGQGWLAYNHTAARRTAKQVGDGCQGLD